MSPMALALIQLILVYGIPGAIQIINIVTKENVTSEDIEKLKDIKPPESFFTIRVG